MKTQHKGMKLIAMLLCIAMIATMIPVIASAELATPVLISAVASGNGIKVYWNAVDGAEGYQVYRKTGNSGWTSLGGAEGTTYQDNTALPNVTYTYTVRAKTGGVVNSGYNKFGVSAAWTDSTAGNLPTPKLVSAKAEATGIRFKWNKVTGAVGYRIYRKTTGSWQFLADVGITDNYLDTSCASGVKYTYTVRVLNSGKLVSGYDKTGKSATWNSGLAPGELPAPKLKNVTAEGSGLRFSWNAVAGAAAYRVYRKTGKGGWVSLVTVTGTSYLDNTAAKGVTYVYTARCVDDDGKLISAYDKNGVKGSWTSGGTGYPLPTPSLKTAVNKVGGVEVTWEIVDGAVSYIIYRKSGTSSWVAIGTSTTTSYTDGSVVSGTSYTYTVRARDVEEKLASSYDRTGITRIYYATPVLVSASSATNGIQVTWNASKGAPMYKVFKWNGSSWSALGYTTSTSFMDRKVVIGSSYTYTVRVVSADQKTDLSDYNHTGITGTFTGKSAISGLSNELNGVRVSWLAVTGASSYQVLRKSGEGGWMELTTTAGTSFLDTTAVNNRTYLYRVRAKDAAGNFIGTDDTNGVSKTYYVAPTMDYCMRDSGGLRTYWEAVEGISNYVIYRKYGVGNWEQVGTTSATNFLDTTPPSGTFCYYTVKCADGSGNPVSACDPIGVGETSYMDQPILSAAVNNNGSITVTWNSVDKATNYRVFRRTGDKTSWDTVVDNTTALSWTDTDVLKGKTYYYSVCVIKADGSEELSEFNSTGVKAAYYDAPALTKIYNAKSGVCIEWGAVDYVGTYHIYRKTGNNADWVSIGTSSSTSYTDTAVTSNAHYNYAVRSMVGGADASALSNVKDITYYAAPAMTGISNGNGSVSISWKQEAGIDTYRVYRSTNGGSTWTALTDLSATSYVDATANNPGTTYTYAVTCIKDGAEVSAKNTAVSITYVAPVTNVKATPVAGVHKVKVTWNTVIGVTAYDVYRRTNGTSWTKVGTVTGGSLTDLTPSEGSYWYYVVAIRNGSASAASATAYVEAN